MCIGICMWVCVRVRVCLVGEEKFSVTLFESLAETQTHTDVGRVTGRRFVGCSRVHGNLPKAPRARRFHTI